MIKKSTDISYPKKPRSILYVLFFVIFLLGFPAKNSSAEQHWEKSSYTTQNINVNKTAPVPDQQKEEQGVDPAVTTPIIVKEENYLPPQSETVIEIDANNESEVNPPVITVTPSSVEPLPAPVVEADPVSVIAAPAPTPMVVEPVEEPQAKIIVNDQRLLQPGDKLFLYVQDEKKMSGHHVVENDYTIDVPLIGIMSVKGKTLYEAEKAILRELTNGYLKSPTIKLQRSENVSKEMYR